MAVMIPYSLDEFVAMGQFMRDAHRSGKPFWRTLWMGDAMEGGSADSAKGFAGTTREMIAEAARGVTLPNTLILSIAIGVWLMFTRLTFDNTGAMANSDHLVGALVVTFSIIAWAEVTRSVRFVNVVFGLWLIVAPWLLEGVGSALGVERHDQRRAADRAGAASRQHPKLVRGLGPLYRVVGIDTRGNFASGSPCLM